MPLQVAHTSGEFCEWRECITTSECGGCSQQTPVLVHCMHRCALGLMIVLGRGSHLGVVADAVLAA